MPYLPLRQNGAAGSAGFIASDCGQKAILPPLRGRIALSANERIAEFLDFAIRVNFAYVNALQRALCPLQTVDKKLFSPLRGRIALPANEKIAEFLDFAIQVKFAYVNKLRGLYARFFHARKAAQHRLRVQNFNV